VGKEMGMGMAMLERRSGGFMLQVVICMRLTFVGFVA